MKKAFLLWVFAALPVTALCLGLYGVGQNIYRQTMDDPQIQIAEDAAARLNTGAVPAALVQRNEPLVDIAASLAPWLAVYDASGTVLEASAQLDNAPPHLPVGLFDQSTWNPNKVRHAPAGDETRVTWQPQPGLRQAVILVHTKDGRFVAAGRSMRTTEERIIQLGKNILIGWLITLGALLVVSLGYVQFSNGRSQKNN